MQALKQTAAKIQKKNRRRKSTSVEDVDPATKKLLQNMDAMKLENGGVNSNALVTSEILDPSVVGAKNAQSDDESDDENFYTTVTKYELASTTTLHFIAINGEKTEIKLDDRIYNYTNLQCEIARLLPNADQLFLIQDDKGQTIDSTYPVQNLDTIRIKEVGIKPQRAVTAGLIARWETDCYHGNLNRRRIPTKSQEEEDW